MTSISLPAQKYGLALKLHAIAGVGLCYKRHRCRRRRRSVHPSLFRVRGEKEEIEVIVQNYPDARQERYFRANKWNN